MKGFLSLVLVSIALLQMTAAASEGSQAIKKREGEQSVSQLACSIRTRLTRMYRCREAQLVAWQIQA
ncbi:hypothetical protein BDR03DRAFT_964548 [Suillus americanus]|nr:hypothetical protein BDR03DRAFT_964548 [Suillus americanus]